MSSVSINGRDLSSLGIGFTGAEGWADSPEESRDAMQLAGQWGQSESDVETVRPRTITIEGRIRGNTVATRNAVLERAVGSMQGLVEITPADQPDRYVLGRLARVRTRAPYGILTFGRDVLNVELEFTCHSPLYTDRYAQIAGFDTTARPVPMGTGPHKGIIRVSGQPTDPTITVRDFRGSVVATLELDGTLAADEAWIIDLYRHRIWLSDSGVLSSADDALESGYFWFFQAAWADFFNSAWPTIEIDAGHGDLTYYRTYKT